MKKLTSHKRAWLGGSLAALLVLLALMTFTATSQARPLAEDTTPAAQPTDHATPGPNATQTEPASNTAPAGTTVDTESDDFVDTGLNLTPDDLAKLKEIGAGTLSPAQLEVVKQAASDAIAKYGPVVLDKLNEKATRKQEQRLFWVAVLIIGIIPALGFLLFMVYPLIVRKKIAERAPGVKMGRLYGLYVPQAFMIWVLLLGLGAGLWGIQFLNGRVLGGITNPQLVFQREAIKYVIDDRDTLIYNYTEMMVGVADDLLRADPEKPVMDTILENALQLKDDPLVSATNSIVKFVMPFMSYLSLISYGILLLLFLVRIRPEIMNLLRYPVEILAAEHSGGNLPDYNSPSTGLIKAGPDANKTVRQIGVGLMITEAKVIALFAVFVLVAALILSVVLVLFFNPVVYYLLDNIFLAVQHFLTAENAATPLVYSTVLLLVFVVECIVIFLLAFILALADFQAVLRLRIGGRINTAQTRQYSIKVGLRFGWVLLLLSVFGMGLPFIMDKIDDLLYAPTDKDPNWTLILFTTPIALLIGLNIGLWLLRGFRMILHLITKGAEADLGLKPPKPKKEKKTPAAPATV